MLPNEARQQAAHFLHAIFQPISDVTASCLPVRANMCPADRPANHSLA